jgi:Tol biopolymer transport system component
MTERWKTQLERLERLHPDEDLLERARHRPLPPLPSQSPRRRVAAIVVAAALTAGLALGGYLVLSDRSRPRIAVGGTPDVVENGDLLFAANLENAWHIYSVDPDTGERRELSSGVRDYGSDWSPDGKKIVYDSESGSGYGIVIADADGSNPVRIADGQSPAWSPDGTRIAFVGEDDAIWVANADGSEAHAITDPATASRESSQQRTVDWNPSWSPDGRSIAYVRFVADRWADMPSGEGRTYVTLEELRIWSEDGSDVALTDAYAFLGEPDWSPDGSTLVFTGAPTLFHEKVTNGIAWPRVLTILAGGGDVTPITPERERWISGATWSPDGEWIAFQDDYETIAIVQPDGSDRSEIDLGHEVIGLSWGVALRSEENAA